MKQETNAIENMNTWSPAVLPPGHNAGKNRWVHASKKDPNTNQTRYGARLVAKGFIQRAGIDYQEVYSPVANYATLRWLQIVVAQCSLKMLQLGIKNSFLNWKVDENIYLVQPLGFRLTKEERNALKLHKAVYGLNKASRTWYDTVYKFLTSVGFQQSTADPGFYIGSQEEGAGFFWFTRTKC